MPAEEEDKEEKEEEEGEEEKEEGEEGRGKGRIIMLSEFRTPPDGLKLK